MLNDKLPIDEVLSRLQNALISETLHLKCDPEVLEAVEDIISKTVATFKQQYGK